VRACAEFFWLCWQLEEGAQGPVAFERILEMYKKNAITLDTYVWHAQYGDSWLRLKDTG
jgi:hypothetical protein